MGHSLSENLKVETIIPGDNATSGGAILTDDHRAVVKCADFKVIIPFPLHSAQLYFRAPPTYRPGAGPRPPRAGRSEDNISVE